MKMSVTPKFRFSCLIIFLVLVTSGVYGSLKLEQDEKLHEEKHFRTKRQKDASPTTTKVPDWMDLSITLPSKGRGEVAQEHEIHELNLELRYEDDKPPTRFTLQKPNLTWTGEKKTHHISVKSGEVQHVQPRPLRREEGESARLETRGCKCPDVDMDQIIEKIVRSSALKGERGDRGFPGLTIQGPKGEPGEAATIPYHVLERMKGERGPQGPPGYCSPRDCIQRDGSRPPIPIPPGPTPTTQRPSLGAPPENLYKIVPGALVFPDKRAMMQMIPHTFIGTVAFVEEDETFYGRVKGGWKTFDLDTQVQRTTMGPPPPPSQQERQRERQHAFALERPPEKIVQNSNLNPNCPPGSIMCSPDIVRVQKEQPAEAATTASTTRTPSRPTQHRHRHMTKSLHSGGPIRGILRVRRTDLFIDTTPPRQRRVIALNSLLNGNMGGKNQINYQCQRQAMKTGLQGIFRAFHLMPQTPTFPLSLDFVNLKNQSLVTGTGKLLYSFNGKEIMRERRVWMPNDHDTCHSWTSDSLSDRGTTSIIVNNGNRFSFQNLVWSTESSHPEPCDRRNLVLCIEFLHMNQIHVRHRNHHGKNSRISFDKYLAILRRCDQGDNDTNSSNDDENNDPKLGH